MLASFYLTKQHNWKNLLWILTLESTILEHDVTRKKTAKGNHNISRWNACELIKIFCFVTQPKSQKTSATSVCNQTIKYYLTTSYLKAASQKQFIPQTSEGSIQ